MAGRRGGFRGATTRVAYEWTAVGDAHATQTIPGKLIGVTSYLAALPQTVVRIRGTVGATLDAATVDEFLIVRFGIVKTTSDAFIAGVASLPGPGSDRDQDWIWTGQLFLTSGGQAAMNENLLSAQLVLDTKAQRKMRSNEVLVFMAEVLVAEYVDTGGTLDFVYAFDVLVRAT